MRRLTSLVRHVRTLQYVLIAVLAFTLGGATVVQAVAPSGILGTVQLADRTDTTRLAAVDAAGNVQVKVNNLAATQAVSGTVSVSNFPTTQNVNITGGGNTATSPIFVRDVDEPAKNVYVVGLCANTSKDQNCGPLTVPAGTRFVIEQVSGRCTVGTGSSIEGWKLTAQLNGADNIYWFHDKISAPAGSGETTLGPFFQLSRIYADGSISAVVYNEGGEQAGNVACIITLSGHLVSIP
jgi:hypothetical protein